MKKRLKARALAQLESVVKYTVAAHELDANEEEGLAPAVATPLGGGSAVAKIAASVSGDPAAIAGALLGSVAEAAVSATLLYRKLDAALEGTAYSYIKSLQSK
ncbi:MAG: hypothetical protein HY791_06985 [Deltaproteobacteria bacterium]|nr:hypothetical protein [Deltaproteobacteria bacterium]